MTKSRERLRKQLLRMCEAPRLNWLQRRMFWHRLRRWGGGPLDEPT